MLLGDLGDDVIKVERPGVGDDSLWGPPFVGGGSAYFLGLNRNKRSLTLDLGEETGSRIAPAGGRGRCGRGELRAGHDEVVGARLRGSAPEEPRPGVLLDQRIPSTGPYRDRAGYDVMVPRWAA